MSITPVTEGLRAPTEDEQEGRRGAFDEMAEHPLDDDLPAPLPPLDDEHPERESKEDEVAEPKFICDVEGCVGDDGRKREFGSAQALGKHKQAAHGIAGAQRARRTKEPTKASAARSVSKRARKPRAKRQEPVAAATEKEMKVILSIDIDSPMATLLPPEHLSEREHAAFRLGVLTTLEAAVAAGDLIPPSGIFAEMLHNERLYREQQLATS